MTDNLNKVMDKVWYGIAATPDHKFETFWEINLVGTVRYSVVPGGSSPVTPATHPEHSTDSPNTLSIRSSPPSNKPPSHPHHPHAHHPNAHQWDEGKEGKTFKNHTLTTDVSTGKRGDTTRGNYWQGTSAKCVPLPAATATATTAAAAAAAKAAEAAAEAATAATATAHPPTHPTPGRVCSLSALA